MKKRIATFILIAAILLGLCACSKSSQDSYFRITFIDVGQGDAALVECDGEYMLIDGGSSKKGIMSGGYEYAGDKIYDLLKDKGITELDYLVVSHLHEDHYGGLVKALSNVRTIGRTLSNATYPNTDTDAFGEFEKQLGVIGTSITVPHVGDKPYKLGSADVEVIDVGERKNNDSLVLLITYGKTRFLFTGDIEKNGQLRTAERLRERHSDFDGISLIKMPHHGAYNDDHGVQESALNSLFWHYDPSYFIISVGENNQHKHPHEETLDIIEQIVVRVKELDWNNHVFRTDKNGDITVKSNGKEISVTTSKSP